MSSNLFTILDILLFLVCLACSVHLGGMRRSTDYYDKAMPGQMDDKGSTDPPRPQP